MVQHQKPATGFSVANLSAVLRRYGVDLRTFLLLLPAGGVFYIDAAIAKTVFFSMLFMGVVALVSHVLRKVYFPYVDLEKVLAAAVQSGTGAGLVVLGVCIIMAAVVIGSVMWMAH